VAAAATNVILTRHTAVEVTFVGSGPFGPVPRFPPLTFGRAAADAYGANDGRGRESLTVPPARYSVVPANATSPR